MKCFPAFDADDELKGKYVPLDSLSAQRRSELIANGSLFHSPNGVTLLEAAGAARLWPQNRGIFCAESERFFIWVNEEDHMRIISMQQGGDIVAVFKRWCDGVKIIEEQLRGQDSGFQFDDHYG